MPAAFPKRVPRIALLLLVCALFACAKPSAVLPGHVFADQPASILVVTDRVANPAFAPLHATEVTNALRHFSSQTRWTFVDRVTPQQVASAGAVVYLGDNGGAPVPAAAMQAFAKAKILVLTRYHVHQFHDAKIAFEHVTEGADVAAQGPLMATYRGTEVAVRQADYLKLTVTAPAQTVAEFQTGATKTPYIVREGNATFINGTIDYDRLEAVTMRSSQNLHHLVDLSTM